MISCGCIDVLMTLTSIRSAALMTCVSQSNRVADV